MGVYNDMANDAGYAYGTEENQQMAQMIEYEEILEQEKYWAEQQAIEEYYEILFRRF